MKIRRAMLFALPVAAAATIAAAQSQPEPDANAAATQATGAAAAEPEIVTRTYDVADLTLRPTDYPLAWSTRGAQGQLAPQEYGPNQSADWITERLESLVAQDSWRVNGGTLGTIAGDAINGKIIVAQTRENHASIARFLAELRGDAAKPMVRVRAAWIVLDDATAGDIDRRARAAAPAGATSASPVVDDATFDRAERYAAAQTTCFDGQTVSLASERAWSIVTDVNPVVGAGAVGYDPTVSRARSAATLQLTPRLAAGGDAVVIDLRSVVVETRAPTTKPTSQPADGTFDRRLIDAQDVAEQTIATTVRLPLGKRVIVAGTTRDADRRTLSLVVEVDAVR